MIKTCQVHGETKYRKESKRTNSWRCIKCASTAVQKRRDKLKLLAVEYKGSCCSICGYNKCVAALEFHHTDPSEKDFGISAKGLTRSWDKLKEELDKCILVCANCHREIHFELDNK
jgi:PHP family Zn ribbon phosphoesterase